MSRKTTQKVFPDDVPGNGPRDFDFVRTFDGHRSIDKYHSDKSWTDADYRRNAAHYEDFTE